MLEHKEQLKFLDIFQLLLCLDSLVILMGYGLKDETCLQYW